MLSRRGRPAERAKSGNLGVWVGVIVIALVVIFLFVLLCKLSMVFVSRTERSTFLVVGGANIMVFAAILFQAVIYLRMAGQNERLIRASEDNAKVAREAFHIGEAPYFGIAQIAPEGFQGEYAPYVKVSFVNGGKTPGWHFHALAKVVVGETPDCGEVHHLETQWTDLPNAFCRTGDTRTFGFTSPYFRYSSRLDQELSAGHKQMFLIVKIHYADFRKKLHHRDFRLVWDVLYSNFKDYDAEQQNCRQCIKLASPNVST